MANNTNVEWVPSLEELDDMMSDINNPSIDDCKPTFPRNNDSDLNSVPSLFPHGLQHSHALCEICERVFSTKLSLTRHLKDVHKYTFPRNNDSDLNSVPSLFPHGLQQDTLCDICERVFSTKSSLTRHLKDVHKYTRDTETTIFNLPPPSSLVSVQDAIEATKKTGTFMKMNDGKFSCPLCPKTYTTKQSAANHLLAEHTTHKYTCKICQAKYTKKSSLKIHHLRVHGSWSILLDD